MIAKLIRWIARAEIAQIQSVYEAQCQQAYANGYNSGRAVGHGEMLAHLRGDTTEPVTSLILAARAAAMIH